MMDRQPRIAPPTYAIAPPTHVDHFEEFFLVDVQIKDFMEKCTELEKCQSTASAIRFVTLVHQMLTMFSGVKLASAMCGKKHFSNVAVEEQLSWIGINIGRDPNSHFYADLTVAEDLKNRSSYKIKVQYPFKNEYSFLLWSLRELDRKFTWLRKSKKPGKEVQCRFQIMDSLEAIEQLLSVVEPSNSGGKLQHCLVFNSVLKSFRKDQIFLGLSGNNGFNPQQMSVLAKLFPRLIVGVVSEILASFDLPVSALIKFADHLEVFNSGDRDEFLDRIHEIRKYRNCSSHTLPVREEDFAKFQENAKYVIDVLKALSTFTLGNRTRYKLPECFPGLQKYFLTASDKMLRSSYTLTEILNQNAMLADEVSNKDQLIDKQKQEIAKKNEQLAAMAREIDELKARYVETPPSTLLVRRGPLDTDKKTSQPSVPFSPNNTLQIAAGVEETLSDLKVTEDLVSTVGTEPDDDTCTLRDKTSSILTHVDSY